MPDELLILGRADLEALEVGLEPWAEQVGAEVEVDGEVLVVTSCR